MEEEENGVMLVNEKEALPGFTAKEQRVIVRYLHHMKTRSTEIHKLLESICGESAAPYKLVKEWIYFASRGMEDIEEQNKNAVSTATNGAVSPKQILPTDPALVYRMELLVNNNRRMGIDRAAEMCMVTKQTAQHVLCDVLGLKKVFDRWVPRLWTPEQRAFRVHVADELLERYDSEGDDFLNRIIVGDETLVYYYTPDKLRRSSCPRPQGEHGVGEKFRPSLEKDAVYVILYYDVYGLLLAEERPHHCDDPNENYSKILRINLAEAYARKRRGKKLKDCLLLHDNTAAHMSTHTQTVLKGLGLEALPHPPASPDLEPHEYWLIQFLKYNMKGAEFHERHSIIAALNHHLKHLLEEEYNRSIKRLAGRWATCKDTSGLYVL